RHRTGRPAGSLRVLQQPPHRLDVHRGVARLEAPRNRLADRPATRALAVESELGAEAAESVQDVTATVTELRVPHDRRDGEFTLADERLRIDDEPGFALR